MHTRRVSIALAYLFLVMLASSARAQVLSNEFELMPDTGPLPVVGAGFSVAISGDTAVVGALYSGGGSAGSAHVYVKTGSTWTFEATLLPDTPMDYDHFGSHVAIDGNTILVSSPYTEQVPHDVGAVYVFERTNGVWSQTARLQSPMNFDGADWTYFGVSVAIDGNIAVVGDHGNQDDDGRVLVFTRTNGVWNVNNPGS